MVPTLSVRLNLYPTKMPLPLLLALGLQAVATVYFVAETLLEFGLTGNWPHLMAELLVALSLAIGIVLTMRSLRQSLRQANEEASALQAARTALTDVMSRQFDIWNLSAAERSIARHSLRGLDIEEISRLRGSALGTVRAQFAHIYAKSGVSNRAQLASVFLSGLMEAEPDHPTPPAISRQSERTRTRHDL